MQIRFARSASRHGISQRRVTYVVTHCPLPLHMTDPSDRDEIVMFLGVDENGVPIEVGAVERTDEELIVIHAMLLRPKLRADFERVMRWHER